MIIKILNKTLSKVYPINTWSQNEVKSPLCNLNQKVANIEKKMIVFLG